MNAYEILVITLAILITPLPLWLIWKAWEEQRNQTGKGLRL
uniref:Uncharacterized protein n=1 Tax=Candidatus Kentrum sp. LFY TaxID=2126342 RepID=A0A450W9H5_9GAMM|nr:MAG: hypothetical protein BECKLFY1418C_GA0070996_10049 [Candidatus Kentron sp. LFY]